MKDYLTRTFGLIVAFIVPGAILYRTAAVEILIGWDELRAKVRAAPALAVVSEKAVATKSVEVLSS